METEDRAVRGRRQTGRCIAEAEEISIFESDDFVTVSTGWAAIATVIVIVIVTVTITPGGRQGFGVYNRLAASRDHLKITPVI